MISRRNPPANIPPIFIGDYNWMGIEITITGNDRRWETDLDSAYAGTQKIIR